MSEDRSRQRLGRGLASLIGGDGGAPSGQIPGFSANGNRNGAQSGERRIPVEQIQANPRNPRRSFEPSELEELVASVKAHGVVQPILVRPAPGEPERWEIVAGERRWRAAKQAGLAAIPTVVREMTDRQSLEIAIIENVQRSDLNGIEEALGYEMLIDEHGYTQSDLAEVLGKSRSHVANTLRLLKLPDDVKELVQAGKLSAGHARTAVSAEDPAGFAREIMTRGLSVREAEDLARTRGGAGEAGGPSPSASRQGRAGRKRPSVPAASAKDADTVALEKLLAEALGMSVSIDFSGEGGSLRIDYGSLDELDEVCRRLQSGAGGRTVSITQIRSL
ncbi:ParB/RepB/Spo0J family partition protein [Aurantimonas sp. MSK8Z-1]|uniref:ParB/RepB/Spo0J family partition protein n=1 Tax=Mangrovibrevibacter kandeliae TaxID=2968473 RepID=UPI002119AAF2|nr:ParB/RepB/Spo0J family partition protein [Aurantimonas sp. MSK8Z-1]MCW4115053.1 ParB/RepB/Spo0J family partition protein [Aurantimonas sp. MSK8Z-1]